MKFKIGAKVKVKSLDWYNENKDEDGNVNDDERGPIFMEMMKVFCGQVLTIHDVDVNHYVVKESNHYSFADYMLEDDIVEESLDLTKILEGCEGIELWSPIYGEVELKNILSEDDYNFPIECTNIASNVCTFTKEGYYTFSHDDTAEIMLYPSKDQRDWSKFEKSRWRAKDGEPYWYVSDVGEPGQHIDCRDCYDNARFEYGNYFRTIKEAAESAERIRAIFSRRN